MDQKVIRQLAKKHHLPVAAVEKRIKEWTDCDMLTAEYIKSLERRVA